MDRQGCTREHKQAVDWLNEHTDDKINIFAIEMELWKIGESPYAPKFQLISQPNDWAKAVRASSGQSALSETKLMQREFWNQFKTFVSSRQTGLRLRKAHPQHWYDLSIGSSKAHLSLVVDTQGEQIRCELYIPDCKELFSALYSGHESIEADLVDYELEWMELPGKKASRVKTSLSIDVNNPDLWDTCYTWLLKAAEAFQAIFSARIK